VFHPQAGEFFSYAFDLLSSFTPFDGIILRGNTPFTYTNGSNIYTPPERTSRFLTSNPEDQGDYEGYKINQNQSVMGYDNVPFVPGY